MRSVVLASCEGERYIGAQLDSIIPQLSADDEIIISDDASTDGTLDEIARRKDGRIVVHRNAVRIGYIGNFQRAIQQSRGDVIFFSDQDDIWLPNKIAIMDAALKLKSCACSDSIVVDENLRQIHPSYFKWRRTRGYSAWPIFLKPPVIGATLACRTRYLTSLLPFPAGVPHDFWISFNAAWDDSLEVIHAPLILYRRHSRALSPTATTRQRRRLYTIFAERYRLLRAAFRLRT
jgi:glycosyltransferase involved in cell wall biosynthesis